MRRTALWLALLVSAVPALAALNTGDAAPHFKAQASLDGKVFEFSLSSALERGPVVVYFYPSAYTGGCNLQARTFAVNQEKFAAAGATVIGVSLDKIDVLKQYSADPEYCAGKVAVASDATGAIAQSYELQLRAPEPGKTDTRGVPITHARAERTTFVVTPDGKIHAVIGGLKPNENVAAALAAVQKLASIKTAATHR
jgi:peroxiredoxin